MSEIRRKLVIVGDGACGKVRRPSLLLLCGLPAPPLVSLRGVVARCCYSCIVSLLALLPIFQLTLLSSLHRGSEAGFRWVLAHGESRL